MDLAKIICNHIGGGFPCGSAGKESTYNVGDLCSVPGLGRSPGEGKCYLLRYSGLENSMDCIVYVLPKRALHGLYSPWGRKELDKTEQLSLHILEGVG